MWEHDCVIVPGLGGFLLRYHEAQYHPVTHLWRPPSKMISFNASLSVSDGVLAHALARNSGISFREAEQYLLTWGERMNALLREQQELVFPGIGRLYRDVEGHVQFHPETAVNYLASAYGLPNFEAAPVLRQRESIEVPLFEKHRPSVIVRKRNRWPLAAAVIFLLGLGVLIGLINTNLDIPALRLNEAGMLHWVEAVHPVAHLDVQPKPVMTNNPETWPGIEFNAVNPITPLSLDTNNILPAVETGNGYFVMVGAFKETGNVDRAEQFIHEHFPGAVIYKDTSPYFVRIGFKAGDSYAEGLNALREARQFDTAFWLLRK